MEGRFFTFVGGGTGDWRIVRMHAISGEPLPEATRLRIVPGSITEPKDSSWFLRGITSNERYVQRAEKERLSTKQPTLGRPASTYAALIPIRKNASWWALSQDDRRLIFEEQSRHIQIGLRYLPAIARRLHHCRDLGEREPFDFLTWFEYAPSDSEAFDSLAAELRRSPEWSFVEREIDIRLARD